MDHRQPIGHAGGLYLGLLLVWHSLAFSEACAQQAPSPSATASPTRAVSPKGTPLQTVLVTGRQSGLVGVAGSASEGVVGNDEISERPILRPGEVLETVPGMIITQHAGGGKANQFFLRGYNLDHGTDFSVCIDGAPINLPSHAHGEGYDDLNILIPELIQTVDYNKGVYNALVGDFSSAGSASLNYYDRLPANIVLHNVPNLPHGLEASLRWRYFGPRELTQSNQIHSEATSLFYLRLGYDFNPQFSIAVDVFNLLNTHAQDIAYYYASRLKFEPPGPDAGGYNDIEVHPAESRSVRLTFTARF